MKSIEAAILDRLRESGSCCFDDIFTYLPDLTWGEVFVAVDRMSRDGRLSLRQLGYSTYQISLGPQFAGASLYAPTDSLRTISNKTSLGKRSRTA